MVGLLEALRFSFGWTLRDPLVFEYLDTQMPPGHRIVEIFESPGFRIVGLLGSPGFRIV